MDAGIKHLLNITRDATANTPDAFNGVSTTMRADFVFVPTATQQQYSGSGDPQHRSNHLRRFKRPTLQGQLTAQGIVNLGTKRLVRCKKQNVRRTHDGIFNSDRLHCMPTTKILHAQQKNSKSGNPSGDETVLARSKYVRVQRY